MANPDDLTLFARVRANMDRYARQTGDLTDLNQLLALAERGSMGEGEDTGPGWFVMKLAINQVRLPLRDNGDGDIEDANGKQVFLIDPNGERPNRKVAAIAEAVVLAINTCGGFHPRVPHEVEPCAECGVLPPCHCETAATRCQAPGCDNLTDRGICASCDQWVTEQVASMNAGSDAAFISDSTNGGLPS